MEATQIYESNFLPNVPEEEVEALNNKLEQLWESCPSFTAEDIANQKVAG